VAGNLDELAATLPDVAAKLGPGYAWTHEAEAALFAFLIAGTSAAGVAGRLAQPVRHSALIVYMPLL
jgi:hypothetical protein